MLKGVPANQREGLLALQNGTQYVQPLRGLGGEASLPRTRVVDPNLARESYTAQKTYYETMSRPAADIGPYRDTYRPEYDLNALNAQPILITLRSGPVLQAVAEGTGADVGGRIGVGLGKAEAATRPASSSAPASREANAR
jgi:hypothetical protein